MGGRGKSASNTLEFGCWTRWGSHTYWVVKLSPQNLYSTNISLTAWLQLFQYFEIFRKSIIEDFTIFTQTIRKLNLLHQGLFLMTVFLSKWSLLFCPNLGSLYSSPEGRKRTPQWDGWVQGWVRYKAQDWQKYLIMPEGDEANEMKMGLSQGHGKGCSLTRSRTL